MHEYDSVLKELSGSAVETLRELAGVTVRRWLNVELPEVRGTRVDMLGESDEGELIHLGLQSINDSAMALRTAEYCLRVYRPYGRFPRGRLYRMSGKNRWRCQRVSSAPIWRSAAGRWISGHWTASDCSRASGWAIK